MKLSNYAVISAIQGENYGEALEILMENFGLSDAARAGVRLALATRPDFLVVKKDKTHHRLALRFNYMNYFWADDGSLAQSDTSLGDSAFVVHHRRNETR